VACMQSAELLMLPHVNASCIQQSQTSLMHTLGAQDTIAILGSIGASSTTASQ